MPSELITTGGYLVSVGLRAIGRELRLGVPKLPPLARRNTSVSWSAKEPSALGMRVAGTLVLERLAGFAGADAAGDLSMLPPATVRTGFVPALSLGLPRSALSRSAADGGG